MDGQGPSRVLQREASELLGLITGEKLKYTSAFFLLVSSLLKELHYDIEDSKK
jgi:hypothetical protein